MGQKNQNTRGKSTIKIFLWLIFLAFFIYSFKSIIDFKYLMDSRRQYQLFRILSLLTKPNFSDPEMNREMMIKIFQTIQMGFLATSIGSLVAIPFSYFGTRTSTRPGRFFHFFFQFIFTILRSVHPLIITIFAIVFAGIGTTAGVLALVIFSIAIMTKEFSEYTKQNPSLSFSTLLSKFYPAIAFKYLPTSILIATVLGFTGGGGIGFSLQQNINLLNYRDASAAILICILVIGSLDFISQLVWNKIQDNV